MTDAHLDILKAIASGANYSATEVVAAARARKIENFKPLGEFMLAFWREEDFATGALFHQYPQGPAAIDCVRAESSKLATRCGEDFADPRRAPRD